MKVFTFVLIFFSLVYSHGQTLNKHIVWIDTDPSVGRVNRDVDDGLALLQAFHSKELTIRGISVVFGNTPLKYAYPIAQKFSKKFAPQKIEVYPGAATARQLGKNTAASQAIKKALSKEKLTILALGPATNIATVIQNYPKISQNIIQIIAVAGRRPGQRFTTGTSNKKAHRDFNFEQDPKAFEVILNSSIPLVLAPFEISSQVWIKAENLLAFEKGNRATKWLAPAAKNWLDLWKSVFKVDGFNPFDCLAISYLTHPDLIYYQDLPAKIMVLADDATEERMQGTKVKEKPYLLVSSSFKGQRLIRYCFKPNKKLKQVILQRLLSKK